MVTNHSLSSCERPALNEYRAPSGLSRLRRPTRAWAAVALRNGSTGTGAVKVGQAANPLRVSPAAQEPQSAKEPLLPQPSSSSKIAPGSAEIRGNLERSFQADSRATKSEAEASPCREHGEEIMTSNWEHRAITCGSLSLIGLLLAKGLSEIGSFGDTASSFAAFLFAYLLSDFLTGVYHWGVDNYGDGNTPVVGQQIVAFQGHHQKPWTITQRQFCNNVHKVLQPAAPFTAVCLAVSPLTPAWIDVGLASATFLTCMSQQFHAWAHMKASSLPQAVKVLQELGLLVSRKAHGAHHKAPFEGNYCIVSGAWNPILDAGGDGSFFRRLEKLVHKRTGIEPRCWHEPDYTWQEE